MDFDSWLQEKGHTGFLPDAVARKLYDDFVKEKTPPAVQRVKLSDGSEADVVAGQVIRPPKPNVEVFTDERGYKQILDLDTGLVRGATNAQGLPIKEAAKKSGPAFMMGPDGRPMFMPDSMALPEASPTPSPASVAPMGAGAYETNLPTPVAAPMLSPAAMAPGQGMSMTPMPQAAAPAAPADAAPAGPRTLTRAQYKQMTGQDLAPGQYEDARGQAFDIVP